MRVDIFLPYNTCCTSAESSDKLRWVLHKQRWITHEFCEINDNIYHKRDSVIKWKDPAKVIGQDGPVVLLSHGSFVVKVNCNYL